MTRPDMPIQTQESTHEIPTRPSPSFTHPDYPSCFTDPPTYPTAHALARPAVSGIPRL
ncbi:hypothetical protein PAXRUDRAFT_16667 [Paxillus rubicundulus Ve08.2h10]|uniref:Uncharacterized protein n=1 Tax=Paxillus rubicundulus Ve08.2h10 TaxID=930991 RepID=A0A0D0DDJ2_9AGAM|nr:hypothetical protein PAXRUDRAFT_16667 [Paxillus rubicundulus Ve08.2h10]